MAHLADHVLAYGKEKPPKGKKEITEMHIKKAHGGFHVTHHHKLHPPEEHVIAGEDEREAMDNLHGHMEEHMGTPNPGEAEAENGEA